MISSILKNLCEYINNNTRVVVQLANIATLSDDDAHIEDKAAIILSIVNIEEDKTLKNISLYKRPDLETGKIDRYKRPAQNLILSLLFTSYNKDNTMYLEGMDKLEQIIRYLQSNNVYYYNDVMGLKAQGEVSEEEIKLSDKIILDMVSLKTDQANQLWSYLGSKYMTSVLYTLRLIYIQSDDIINQSIITSAGLELQKKTTGGTETIEDKEIPLPSDTN